MKARIVAESLSERDAYLLELERQQNEDGVSESESEDE
jgi:hypothetical protein